MANQLINELGNRYGLLTVIGSTKDKNNKTVWVCQCDCGNIKILRGHDLRKGNNKTCGKGCPLKYKYNSKFKDITGQKFGKLTVLSFKEINSHHQSVWHCKCDCGNECDIIGCRMTEGIIQSCGCLTSSSEKKINQYLSDLHITYKSEQTFNDLLGIRGGHLRYDFAIYKNNIIIGLIEFQGEQHFKSVKYWGGDKEFQIRQQHDEMKFNYAKSHNIPLLYLTQKDNLKEKILQFINDINIEVI